MTLVLILEGLVDLAFLLQLLDVCAGVAEDLRRAVGQIVKGLEDEGREAHGEDTLALSTEEIVSKEDK